jgi:glutamine synthetase
MKPAEVRTPDDVRRILEERDAEHVTIAMTDMQGLLRGKYVSRNKLLSVLDNDWGLAPVTLALDPDDVIMEAPGIADGSDGFADGTGRLLPATCREIPWEAPQRNLLFLAEYSDKTEAICPRAVYRRIEQKARDMGFQPYHALEYEFTLFEETALSAFEKGYRDLKLATPFKTYLVLQRQAVWAEFYADLLDTFSQMDIPLESAHEEMGPGFMEATMAPQVGVTAADYASIFKTYAKAIAQRRDMLITFMARWSNEADGQSGHVHISACRR